MSSFPQDPFRAAITDAGYPLIRYSGPDYTYWMCDDTDEYDGPNTRAKPSRPGKRVMTFDWFMMSPGPCPTLEWIFYDTSNGVNSLGCIYHSNSKEEKNSGGGNYDHSHGNP